MTTTNTQVARPQPRNDGKPQTAVRWADDNWWIVTTNGNGQVRANNGPFPTTAAVEEHLRYEAAHGDGLQPNRCHPASDPTEIINTLLREGLTRRLANASRAWIEAIDATGGSVAWRDGQDIFDPRLSAGPCPQIDERQREMHKANNAYHEWLNA